MRDATGNPQSIAVLGGNSDLAWEVVDQLADQRLQRAVLAVRDVAGTEARAASLRAKGLTVEVVAYDANDAASHADVLARAADDGDLDVVMVAFGVLGEPFAVEGDPSASAELASINFSAATAATQAAADLLRIQGHGSLVVFSSVAGIRVRGENAVYGAAKAGLDSFATAMADVLHDDGVHVMIVRPGFVRTKMTDGRPDAPFATTADAVAADVIDGLRRRRRIVWSPKLLRFVFAGLRRLPGPLWRRIAS